MTKSAAVPAPPPASARSEDLKHIMMRVGTICHDLATSSEWLQDQLGGLVDRGTLNPCRETTMALQELDRIAQVLHCLSDLNAELASHASGRSAPRNRLSEAIRLESLAERILGGETPSQPEDEFWS